MREALGRLEAPDEHRAEERGRQVVRTAFAEREGADLRRSTRVRATSVLAVAVAIAGFALTPAGAEVREWIGEKMGLGAEDAKPRLGRLPADGSILVESDGGTWVVAEDGSRRRLGGYDLATWSPSGMFVGLTDGPEVRALTPQGETRWVHAPESEDITGLDWSTDDGDRIAYVVGGSRLHVMAADNSSEATFDSTVAPVTPAWRPDRSETRIVRQLAYVDEGGEVRVVDTESGRLVFSHRPDMPVRKLEWQTNGKGLLMVARQGIALRYAPETAMSWEPAVNGKRSAHWEEASIAPGGFAGGSELIAAVSRSRGRSTVELLRQSTSRELITIPSQVSDVTWSPDGEWVVLGLEDADQWLFVRVEDAEVRAFSNISDQFESAGEFPRIAGWCCGP